MNSDGTGLRYFDFKVPNQVTLARAYLALLAPYRFEWRTEAEEGAIRVGVIINDDRRPVEQAQGPISVRVKKILGDDVTFELQKSKIEEWQKTR